MTLHQLNKGRKLILRALGDILKPYRFGFNPDSISAANTTKWRYSLGYRRKGMLEHYSMKRDAAGIVMMCHYLDHASEGHYYSPVKIAHYALAAWNDFVEGDLTALSDFDASVDWLMQNAEPFNGTIIWRTPTSNPRYDLPAGYVSAIVQGLILSVLSRSLVLKNDPKIRSVIDDAASFFHRPVAEGGILSHSPFGIIYEEYPCEPQSHVVNGFMFSLNGLWDAAQTGSSIAKERYEAALPSLTKLVPAWVTKNWSYYDLRYIYDPSKANLATRHYQYLHIDQLKFFASCEQDASYTSTIKRLESQMRNPMNWLTAYLNKGKVLTG